MAAGMTDAEVLPGVKRVVFKQTWDDDCEQVIILHPAAEPNPEPGKLHIHHKRVAICKKAANSITLEPMMPHPDGNRIGHASQWTYVRTTEKDTEGRTIFRQGVAT